MNEIDSLLCEGAELMDISFSDEQLDQLLAYHGLIGKWNKVYNLSAIPVSYTHLTLPTIYSV